MRDKLTLLKKIALDIKSNGGRIFFVGGYVRDLLMGITPKDIDTETYGLTIEKLESILKKYGKVSSIGKSYGILLLKDMDFSIPRIETNTGTSHKDFSVTTHPYLSFSQACRRRDFTINSILMDVLTNELIDPYIGRNHINDKILKHIDEETFTEDPLRVYRGVQFASRFNFEIDRSTQLLCKSMDLSTLPKERIFEEFKKFLLKSKKPSISISYMRTLNMLNYYPELKNLIGCVQDKVHHPEGDVYDHTLLVLDKAASFRHMSKDPLVFMLSALCHDLGKPITTKSIGGRITAHNHHKEGVYITLNFLKRLTNDKKLIDKVCILVKNHMKPFQFYQAKDMITDKAFRKLAIELEPVGGINELLLLSRADHTCRNTNEKESEYEYLINFFNKKISSMKLDNKFLPLITGKDLMNLGLKPSKVFSIILKEAIDMQLEGLDKSTIINHIKSTYC